MVSSLPVKMTFFLALMFKKYVKMQICTGLSVETNANL